jgi:uncharacterized protein (TIGR01244 family)
MSLRPLILCCVLLAGGCATVGRDVPGVKNLATVDPAPEALYRGGQPSKQGIETLRTMGVRTVIDLRNDPVPWERQRVTAAGMTYVHVPTNAAKCDPVRIAQFLMAVRTSERPIFVHCRRGRDRTGLEIAVYRLVDQAEQWTRAAAIAELHRHGHQWLAFPGIQRYLATFDPAPFAAEAASQAGAMVGADAPQSQGN